MKIRFADSNKFLARFAEQAIPSMIVQPEGNFEALKANVNNNSRYNYFKTEYIFKYNAMPSGSTKPPTKIQKDKIRKTIIYWSQAFIRELMMGTYQTQNGSAKLKNGASFLFTSNGEFAVTKLFGSQESIQATLKVYDDTVRYVSENILASTNEQADNALPEAQKKMVEDSEKYLATYFRLIIKNVVMNPKSFFYKLKLTDNEIATIAKMMADKSGGNITAFENIPFQSQEYAMFDVFDTGEIMQGYSKKIADYFHKSLNCLNLLPVQNFNVFKNIASKYKVRLSNPDFYRDKNNLPKIYLQLIVDNNRNFEAVNRFLEEYVFSQSSSAEVPDKFAYIVRAPIDEIKKWYEENWSFQNDQKKKLFDDKCDELKSEFTASLIEGREIKGLLLSDVERNALKSVVTVEEISAKYKKTYEKLMEYLRNAIQSIAYGVEASN
jgi:hypothetical protein